MKTLAQADREARIAACDTFGNPTGVLDIAENGQRHFMVGRYHIEFFGNGGKEPTTHATNFYVREDGREDDISSDYWAGIFRPTLTSAIRYARNASDIGAVRA